jgi:hypothetical protein
MNEVTNIQVTPTIKTLSPEELKNIVEKFCFNPDWLKQNDDEHPSIVPNGIMW